MHHTAQYFIVSRAKISFFGEFMEGILGQILGIFKKNSEKNRNRLGGVIAAISGKICLNKSVEIPQEIRDEIPEGILGKNLEEVVKEFSGKSLKKAHEKSMQKSWVAFLGDARK